ncbi:hypothetical protein CLV49_1405 [Labedella gwakjiensis]|uniref:Uncharacterized protein n=1 Tax=Labedella gwakjiensis TaxID=390269 RepID=A0A2P8GV00_9MICO|nr:hypothetical protein [Labedella gwakjiensis]PSL37798.1 hypothetical protein CLV49_1405 [Labedella gwakjiensis]RUQ87623.1 hypothetical protein ELQ93_12175 [Labedella gwakjiensis]
MPKKPPAVIRFILESDASGAPVRSEHTMPLERVRLNDFQRYANLVVYYTREYAPIETERLDAYRFGGHSSGSGWIVLQGFSPAELAEARDHLRLHRIAEGLGRADPGASGSSGQMVYFLWAMRNPRIDLVVGILGAVFLVSGLGLGLVTVGLTVAYGSTLEPDELLPALGLMVIGAGLAAFGFWRYARRRSWWAEARGAAIRDYGSAPVYLRR